VGTLVGRGPALAAARAALDDVFAGAGQVLLVAGEPGIGKTALLAAIAREAADRGARVLRGVCWAGAAPPWWPWTRCCGPRT
jgi:predicted ATPase